MAFYTPDPIQGVQLIPGGNTPAAGALLFVYSVGTTAKQNSYTDQSASTARTNPIVLDSGGNIPGNGEVWIASSAKFVLAPSNDTDPPGSPYWTRDGVPGINNVSALIASSAAGEWVVGSTATFVGVTAFSVGGDQTALYTLGRRIKATVTGGDRFGIVTSSVFGTSTSVGVTLDSSTLNGGLSAVWYGLLSAVNGSVPWTIETTSGINIIAPVTTAALTVASTCSISGATFVSSNTLIFSNSSAAFAVGANGITNPVLRVDASTIGTQTGFVITGAAASSGVFLTPISPATTESLVLNAKGSGRIRLSNVGATDIQWGTTLVALGGGTTATLSTIGGAGPATGGQNSWMRVLDSAGVPMWIPVWK